MRSNPIQHDATINFSKLQLMQVEPTYAGHEQSLQNMLARTGGFKW